MIIYEPVHSEGDKAYKMVQYRKLNGKDTHQLIFINQTSEYLRSCFDQPAAGLSYNFGFNLADILSVTTHTLSTRPLDFRRYIYALHNYIPFNSNDFAKWMKGAVSHDDKINVLGQKLTDHIARLLCLIDSSHNVDLSIELYDNNLHENIGAYKSTGFSHFDLVFASNIFIPPDLNIGRRATTHGVLTLYNQ